MMIGTCDFARIWRHTSTPEIRGSMTSSSTSPGRTASNRSSASGPSTATSTRKPSRSSATRQRVAVRLLVVDDEDQRCLGHQRRLSSCTGTVISTPSSGNDEPERRALPFHGLDRDLAAVRLDDVAHDGEPEPGSTGRAAARLIDAVEALEDPFEVAARDPDALIASP